MKSDDVILILGLLGVILLVAGLYAFPSDSLIEAIKQSGF